MKLVLETLFFKKIYSIFIRASFFINSIHDSWRSRFKAIVGIIVEYGLFDSASWLAIVSFFPSVIHSPIKSMKKYSRVACDRWKKALCDKQFSRVVLNWRFSIFCAAFASSPFAYSLIALRLFPHYTDLDNEGMLTHGCDGGWERRPKKRITSRLW